MRNKLRRDFWQQDRIEEADRYYPLLHSLSENNVQRVCDNCKCTRVYESCTRDYVLPHHVLLEMGIMPVDMTFTTCCPDCCDYSSTHAKAPKPTGSYIVERVVDKFLRRPNETWERAEYELFSESRGIVVHLSRCPEDGFGIETVVRHSMLNVLRYLDPTSASHGLLAALSKLATVFHREAALLHREPNARLLLGSELSQAASLL